MVPPAAAAEVAGAGGAPGVGGAGMGSCSMPWPSIAAVKPPIGFLAIRRLLKCGSAHVRVYVIKQLVNLSSRLAGGVDFLDCAAVGHRAGIVDPIVHDRGCNRPVLGQRENSLGG